MVPIKLLPAILSYLIALCGYLPLSVWLDPVPRYVCLAAFAAGIWQERRGAWPLKDWMLNLAIVPPFLYYALQFTRSNPVQPVVSILAVLLSVRLCGSKNSRHYLQIATLSLFCLAASSLFDLSPLFLVYLVLLLIMVALLLVLLTFYDQDPTLLLDRRDLRRVVLAGLLLPTLSVPLLLFFFPLLPRTQFPLWNFLAAPISRTSGFSETVTPGSNSSTSESRVTAFRAEMPQQPSQQLYWRGTVFNRPDGIRWLRGGVPAEEAAIRGGRITQVVYPEPSRTRVLPTFDAPSYLELARSQRFPDAVYEWQGLRGKRFSYRVFSTPGGLIPVNGTINRTFYLRLPENMSDRAKALAADIRRSAGDDAGRLAALETYFRNGGFRYSMTGLPTGEQALDLFLFDSRQRHCEFFTSSFALLLRCADVPARLVGGYLGGDYNELGGYYIVTEDMAHVWVEAYVVGKGWQRVDPSSFAQNAGSVWNGKVNRTLLQRVRFIQDSLDHTWNRSVISYDFERQVDAARVAGNRLQKLKIREVAAALLPYLIALILTAGVYGLFMYRDRLLISRNERMLRSFYRCAKRVHGCRFERGRVGLFEIADMSSSPELHEFVNMYAGAVYKDRELSDDEYRKLKLLISKSYTKHTS